MSEMKATPLQSDFGIEDVLSEGSKSFYENIFSTRHLGRVLDFFYFESEAFFNACKDRDLSEYRYRSIAETAVFNAFANKPKMSAQCAEIEVGFDTSRLVISVTHSVPKDLANFMPGDDAGGEKSLSFRFQKMLEQIQKISDGMIIRHSKRSARVQVIAFLSTDSEATNPSISFHEISDLTVKKANSKKTPDEAPVALGSARVEEFLENEQMKEEAPPMNAFDTVVEEAASASDQIESSDSRDKKAAGIDAPVQYDELPESAAAVKGKSVKQIDKDTFLVSGKTIPDQNADLIKIKGGKFEDNTDEVRVKRLALGEPDALDASVAEAESQDPVRGAVEEATLDEAKAIGDEALAAAKTSAPVEKTDEDIALDAEIIRDVEESAHTLTANIRSEIVDVAPNLSEEKFNELFKKATQQIRDNYMRTLEHVKAVHELQMQSKAKHHGDQLAAMNLKVETLKNQLAESGIHDRTGENTVPVDSLVNEKEVKKFDDMVEGYEKRLDMNNAPAQFKEWAKELLADIMKERGDFNTKIRQFETNEKKMVHEIKTKETALYEQLRMKDESFRQKEFTLTKTKEALQTALSSIERFKSAQKESGNPDIQQKLYTTEKMLAVAKDNNDRHVKRVEDLQKRWTAEMTAGGLLKKEVQAKNKLISDLERKCEQIEQLLANGGQNAGEARSEASAQKQIETFKGQVRELQGKLQQANAALAKSQTMVAESARKAALSNNEQQWKLRLDQANKLSKTIKEEADRLRRRFDEVKTSETKLRVEVAQLQTQLKVARGKK